MRDKIYAALVAKHPTLSKHFLGLIATQIAKKVTDEDGIEQGITDFEALASIPELATDFQKEQDRQIGAAKKKWEKEKPNPATTKPAVDVDADEEEDDDPEGQPAATDKPKPKGDRTPAWAKALMADVQSLKSDKLTQSITDKLKAHPKLIDVPESMWKKRVQPTKDEDIDAFVNDVVADYEVIVPVGGASRPATGGNTSSAPKPTDNEIKDLEKAFK